MYNPHEWIMKMLLDLAYLWRSMDIMKVLCLVYQHTESTHHPEEGSCGKVCILLYSRQDTKD